MTKQDRQNRASTFSTMRRQIPRLGRKAKTAIVYGDSGDAKTTQLYFIARYIWQTRQKITRVIVADGGGSEPFYESGLVDTGIVDIYDIRGQIKALADVRRLASGYWPRGTHKEVFESTAQCDTPIHEWQQIGAYVIEGIQSIGDLWKDHIAEQPSGQVGFKHSYEYTEDGEHWGGLQEGHYGMIQNELHSIIVAGFGNLPVEFVFWSSLTGSGETRTSREKVFGPAGPGKRISGEIPSWFGDCFHLERVKQATVVPDGHGGPGQQVVQEQLVAWFQKHYDPSTGLPYLAKPRVAPESLATLYKYFPNGYVPLGLERGLDQYYQILDMIYKERKEQLTNAAPVEQT